MAFYVKLLLLINSKIKMCVGIDNLIGDPRFLYNSIAYDSLFVTIPVIFGKRNSE